MSLESDIAEYRMHWGIIGGQLRVLASLPLDKMLRSVEHAESVGAFLDPTAYRDGMHNLPPQREILQAAIAFRNAGRKHIAGLAEMEAADAE